MPEQSPTLRDMIQEALDNGVTYRELEARATDPQTGKTASRSIFFDTVNGKLDRMPYEHHLRAVAAALRKPYDTVRRAAIAQWLPPAGASSEMGSPDSEDLEAKIDRLLEQVHRLQGEAAAIDARIDRTERPKSA